MLPIEIYIDNASTTQLCQAASEAMLPFQSSGYGNPSSQHQKGRAATQAVENARMEIASQLGAHPEELYFTSGGTEADNWAVHSAAMLGAAQGKRHIISSRIEHHAILNPLKRLESQGFAVTLLGVSQDGRISPADLEAAIRPDTALVTIMFANNEIGTIQPIAEIGAICRRHGVLLHSDAVQAVGHIPIDLASLPIDMLSLSAHKFHGPPGIGALYCRDGVDLHPLLEGGSQERGNRAGTENVPAIVGMAAALSWCCSQPHNSVAALRDRLMEGISRIPGAHLTGSRDNRLPGNVHFCFEGISSAALLMALDMHGIYASSGAACASQQAEPSHVLSALGLPDNLARGALRLSLSAFNTPEEIDHIIATLPRIIAQLRSISGR